MTKKEMIYEMVSNTNWSNVNQNEVDKLVAKSKKVRVEEVYKFFKENPTKASFCLACLGL